jgi:hypothetical protein
MEALIKFLQNNPMIVLGVFVISVLSGLMGIILMSKRFWNDFLSKSITLPVYVYLIIFFVVILAIIFRPAIKDRPKPLRIIKGESFGVQRIFIDGKRFVNCKFRGTELVFKGEADVGLEGCSFFENHRLTFGGPAQNTLNMLKSLYAVPEFRPRIENTFKAIKEGKLTIAIPPSDAADN